jgi:hypothetical protein
MIFKSIKGIFIDLEKVAFKKFYENQSDDYIQYLQVKTWEFNETYNTYFIFLNPMFVICATSIGW